MSKSCSMWDVTKLSSRLTITIRPVNSGNCIYRAYVPKHVVSITGVISGNPVDLSDEEILADIECEAPIMNVSRVQPFTQKLIFCKQCLRYGYRPENCRGRKRCERCGEEHEEKEDNERCVNQIKCLYCKSTAHQSGSNECRETLRQKNIKTIMANQNLTYAEARTALPIATTNFYKPLSRISEFPTIGESFADTTARSNLKQQWAKTSELRQRLTPAVSMRQSPKSKRSSIPNKPSSDRGVLTSTTNQATANACWMIPYDSRPVMESG